MAAYAIAVITVILAWWVSTGIVLMLNHLPGDGQRHARLVLALLAACGTGGLVFLGNVDTVAGAYGAFACALMVWAWHEVSFLTGSVTGPERGPCPQGLKGWDRFKRATAAVIHHELALAATLIVLIALTWEAPNKTGIYAFGILWVMRLSAKLNIFLGVSNLTESFLPSQLDYLKTYFGRRNMNGLMPVSITLGTAAGTWLALLAQGAPGGGYEATAYAILASLLLLAVLEHWLLVLPVKDEVLWAWAQKDVLKQRQINRPVEKSVDKPPLGHIITPGPVPVRSATRR